MMTMRKAFTLLAVVLIMMTPLAGAQKAASSSRGLSSVSNRSAGISRPVGQVLEEVDQRLKALDDRAARTETSLSEIEKRVDDDKKLSLVDLGPALIAAVTGVVGVFVGVFANNKQQRERLEQEAGLAQVKADNDLRLAERQSKANISSAVVDWQLRQLFLLYGPLRALLGQSFSLYRQMNSALCKAAPDRFQLVSSKNPNGQASEDKQEFQILLPGSGWTRFRVVMHMQHVYGQAFDVEIYIDEIVAIGSRVVNIIQEKAGYARAEEADLMGVFARYLAHFAVMAHQHELAKGLNSKNGIRVERDEPESQPRALLNVDLASVFPLELPSLINTGFLAITRDVEEWKRKTLS
ncbi:hypothetical protein [Tunturiibacter gelidiferens]|uniref:hypothetical protein n=1 Tax=Tunturiibacter gelidiferens TaxID=3069689 RepID=UPI003D9B250E